MNDNIKIKVSHALLRLLALIVDIIVAEAVFVLIIRLSGYTLDNFSATSAILLSLGVWYVAVEPLLLARLNTLGYWLLKIKVNGTDGSPTYPQALKRSLMFWIAGLGLGLFPAVMLLLLILNCIYFVRQGAALWDTLSGTAVSYGKPVVLRIIVSSVIVLAVLAAGYQAMIQENKSLEIQPVNIKQQTGWRSKPLYRSLHW